MINHPCCNSFTDLVIPQIAEAVGLMARFSLTGLMIS